MQAVSAQLPWSTLLAVITACSAPQQPATPARVPAATAEPAPAPTAPVASDDGTDNDSDGEPVDPETMAPRSAAAATAAPKPEPAPSKPARPASEFLTEADTDFLVDYSASDLNQAALSKCQASGDAELTGKELADCLQKARDAFAAHVLTFQQGDRGLVTLTIYQRKASQLAEVYSAPVELKDTSDTTVLVSAKGGQRGQRPIFRSQREFTVQVPDAYTVVLDEPQLGRLSYRAKYGLVAH